MNYLERVAKSFIIFAKYQDQPYTLNAQHDVILLDAPNEIDPKDLDYLYDVGWFWSMEFDCWSLFV